MDSFELTLIAMRDLDLQDWCILALRAAALAMVWSMALRQRQGLASPMRWLGLGVFTVLVISAETAALAQALESAGQQVLAPCDPGSLFYDQVECHRTKT